MCVGPSLPALHLPGTAAAYPAGHEGTTGGSAPRCGWSPPAGYLLHYLCSLHSNTVYLQQCEPASHDGGVRTQCEFELRTSGPFGGNVHMLN